jgi:hypothetical protein
VVSIAAGVIAFVVVTVFVVVVVGLVNEVRRWDRRRAQPLDVFFKSGMSLPCAVTCPSVSAVNQKAQVIRRRSVDFDANATIVSKNH